MLQNIKINFSDYFLKNDLKREFPENTKIKIVIWLNEQQTGVGMADFAIPNS